jgi:hypothetical protein
MRFLTSFYLKNNKDINQNPDRLQCKEISIGRGGEDAHPEYVRTSKTLALKPCSSAYLMGQTPPKNNFEFIYTRKPRTSQVRVCFSRLLDVLINTRVALMRATGFSSLSKELLTY